MSAPFPSGPPDFDLRVNGAAIPAAAAADIRSLSADEDVDALGMVTLELYNWDQERLAVSWSDDKLFAVGNELELHLGQVDQLKKVMIAEITGLEVRFAAGSSPMLGVRAHDYRHRLTRDRRTRTFAKMKDSAIASQVAREAGLRSQTTDSKVTVEYVVQHNQTDLEFLSERARLIGYEVTISDKVLSFRPPQHARPAAATLDLGEDVIDFHARLTTMGQVERMTVRGWDVKQKKTIVGSAAVGQEASTMGGRKSGPATAKRAFGQAGGIAVDLSVRSKADADAAALGRFDQMALGYIDGEVVCHGRPDLHPASVVDITGAGTTFSGSYYVRSATHLLTRDEGYRTTLRVRRNAA